MKICHFLGADVSKKTIDIFSHLSKVHVCISNDQKGFKSLLKWLNDQRVCAEECLLVLEHTGLYSRLFEKFMHSAALRFSKVPALEIIRSQGMVRGKSDKIDSARIAEYCFSKQDRISITEPLEEQVERLKMLAAARSSAVKSRTAILNTIKELLNAGLTQSDVIIKGKRNILHAFNKEIKILEQEMKTLIDNNEAIRKNYKLLTGLKGIGKIVATATIVKTANFTLFKDARKFSCYCGTAPFDHSSGTSIRKKHRVSHLADKEMKSLLDMSAKSAKRYYRELKAYYERKIAEGKHPKSVRNAIRCKLIYRMFAVVKRGTPFVEKSAA